MAIDKEDKIWKIFLEYNTLIATESKERGMDMYGTEIISQMALSMTTAHFLDQVATRLKENNKINLRKN